MASTKLTADEVIVVDSSTFVEQAGLTSRDAAELKHYLCGIGKGITCAAGVVKNRLPW